MGSEMCIRDSDKPLYSSSSPVNAALETYPGFFKENNIDLNSSLSWELN